MDDLKLDIFYWQPITSYLLHHHTDQGSKARTACRQRLQRSRCCCQRWSLRLSNHNRHSSRPWSSAPDAASLILHGEARVTEVFKAGYVLFLSKHLCEVLTLGPAVNRKQRGFWRSGLVSQVFNYLFWYHSWHRLIPLCFCTLTFGYILPLFIRFWLNMEYSVLFFLKKS